MKGIGQGKRGEKGEGEMRGWMTEKRTEVKQDEKEKRAQSKKEERRR